LTSRDPGLLWHCLGMLSGVTLRCFVFLWVVGLLVGSAGAQEPDRATPERIRSHGEEGAGETAPVTSSRRHAPRVVDDELDPSLFPRSLDDQDPIDEGGAEAEESGIEVDHGGKLWVAGGYDNNVFRSDRREKRDAFGQAHAEAEILLKFPYGGELYMELAGETLTYLQREKANEHFVSAFLEYYQIVSPWLEVGAQNAFEFSRLNLLDDTGDLLPRGRFGSLDEEPRVFAILRPGDADDPTGGAFLVRDLSFEFGASYRIKDYEENRGLDSLDYEEMRFDASIRYRIARRPRSRIKLKYRFRRRDYRQLRARGRDSFVAADSPHLDLQRHQLNLRWTQQIKLKAYEGRVVADVGVTYNRDTHRNDRSYRELSGTISAEWWPVRDRTRVNFGVRATARNFLVRRPNGRSGHLRHRLLRFRVGVWQRLLSSDDAAKQGETPVLALFSTASYTFWRSDDFREDYDRFLINAGLELSW
jgi:hypothetical protein